MHLLYSIGYYPKGQCFKWYLLKHILGMITVQITYYRAGICLLLAGLHTEMAEFKFCFFVCEFDFRKNALKAEKPIKRKAEDFNYSPEFC